MEDASESIQQSNKESIYNLEPLPFPYVSFMNQIYEMKTIDQVLNEQNQAEQISQDSVEQSESHNEIDHQRHQPATFDRVTCRDNTPTDLIVARNRSRDKKGKEG